jgi:hypothetical protein
MKPGISSVRMTESCPFPTGRQSKAIDTDGRKRSTLVKTAVIARMLYGAGKAIKTERYG